MSATQSNVIKTEVKSAAKKAAYNPLMEGLTRIGYAVRGLIYVMMGLLALNVALGKGGTPASQQGAIQAIGRQPAGLVLLWIILIGLASYALWGVIRAVLDPLHKGHDMKGLMARAGYLFSAAGYAILIPSTFGYIAGSSTTSSSGSKSQGPMASIMATPWGPYALGLIGIAVIASGLYQVYQGINSSFDKQFEAYTMTPQQVKWAIQLGRFGTATRGLIFAVVGILLCVAAYQTNPSQPVGLDAALSAILHQPYGIWLLGIVAVGLVAFGAYSMMSAVWFRLKRENAN